MTVRLTVRSAMWRSHVARLAAEVDGLVPVVKGNGYGFGREWLATIAADFTDTIAVGTVHELDGLPDGVDVVVLTPTLTRPADGAPILTVGCEAHIDALAGWHGRVIVKLESSMHRFGRDVALVDAARAADLDVVGVSVHLPLAGTAEELRAELIDRTSGVDRSLPAWVSHVDPPTYRSLPDDRAWRLRLGTALWHGDKTALHLQADVLDVRAVNGGDTAGYRRTPVPGDGYLVIAGAGTAHGVAPLVDGRSPFHFDRTRLALHEPPHMHASMVFVPAGGRVPAVGEWLDLQRPLHMTAVDEYAWI